MATRRDSRRTGIWPLAYMGVEPVAPNLLLTDNRAPTTQDYKNFNVGTLWIDRSTAPNEDVWILVNKDNNVARWLKVSFAGVTGIQTLTGNDGIIVPADIADNINIIGAAPYYISGNIVTNTLTLTDDGTIATTYLADDAGIATPAGGILKIYGDGILTSTTAAGNQVTIGTTLGVGLDGQVLIGATAGHPAWATITSAGGTVVFTPGPNSLNMEAIGGGGGVLAGWNIHINPASTVNLNDTIHWPDTNAVGTTGVIYLGGGAGVGGYRFFHGYTDPLDLARNETNVFIGQNAGNFTLGPTGGTGTYNKNVGIGTEALANLAGGHGNIAIGDKSLRTCGNGYSNVAIGDHALYALTYGEWNVAIGPTQLDSATTASHNTAVGQSSLSNLTDGWYNVTLGYDCLARLVTGRNNLCIGAYTFTSPAGYNYTGAESSNILINNHGVNGENNTMRIGTTGTTKGQTNRCFIAGIRGITTGVADAIPVLIDSSEQLGTVSSSRRYKQNIQDMQEASSAIYDLRPVTFEFKSHPDIEQYGLIAEEVVEHIPRLVVMDDDGLPETVKYMDLIPMLLNEIKKLNKRIEALEAVK